MFKSKRQSVADLVRLTLEACTVLAANDSKTRVKAQEEVSKHVASMKLVLYGDVERPVVAEQAGKLCLEFVEQKLALPLVRQLSEFQFEAKKDVASVFNNLLRLADDGTVAAVHAADGTDTAGNAAAATDADATEVPPTRFVAHVLDTPAILDLLVHGYESPDIALACGSMLRECARYKPLASEILNSDRVWEFFQYVELANFDVSSDALATFRELLTAHRELVAVFLTSKHDKFFGHYRELLRSDNYVTRRQSLKLLGEIIVHRKNFGVMSKYISSKIDLMLMMNLLRDKSKSIQYEAFHVFKVFVANPKKPADIVRILERNCDRLIAFLQKFRNEVDDDQFKREKAYLIKELETCEKEKEKE